MSNLSHWSIEMTFELAALLGIGAVFLAVAAGKN